MPVFKKRVILEMKKGLKAFIRLDMGLTRGRVELPEWELEQAQEVIRVKTKQLERLKKRLANTDQKLQYTRRRLLNGGQETGGNFPLPTFLIIGAQKSGTVWLNTNLGMHPDVFTPKREVWFFNLDNRFKRGLDWYRAQFEGWNGELIVGETTPGYMMWAQNTTKIATRIDTLLPGVRLIALLRNPIDRAYSAFFHHMSKGRIPTDADFLEYVRSVNHKEDRLGLVSGGWYAASLSPYIEQFGERLRVFLYDEIVDEPEKLYTRVLRHIGASNDFLPPELRRVRHKGSTPKGSNYADKSGGRRPLRPEERAEIYEYFRSDIERLEELLDRDLSAWRPA